MEFRKAEKKDIDVVMQIISDARTRIGKLGIDQWQYGYPTREILIEDVEKGRLWVAEEKREIAAVFAVISEGEPTYRKIYDGAWLTEGENYLAVHRVAVAEQALRKGTGSAVMAFVLDLARQSGRKSLRIDTHEGNIPMRGMLEKNGFRACGTIYLESGEESGRKRIAYEKLV